MLNKVAFSWISIALLTASISGCNFVKSASSSDRGDKDFSFSRDAPTEYSTSKQAPFALQKRATRSDERPLEFQNPPNQSSASSSTSLSREQAGQAGPHSSGMGLRTDAGPQDEKNSGNLKYGTEPGQISTVPGETPSGVHGTVNAFGTGGKPIRLEDPEPSKK
jgi:hypothetical protein